MNSSTTLVRYYLQWEGPSNIKDIDLDYYQLYANETPIQRIHPDQRYAVITLQNNATTIVKITAVDKCRQMSNYSSITITPDQTNSDDTSTELQNSTDSSKSNMASLVAIICTTFLALIF